MLSVHHFACCVGVVALALTSVHGMDDDEKAAVTGMMRPFIKECGKQHGLSLDDIKAAKEAGTLKDLDPCLAACVLKKFGLINDQGLFDVKKSKKLAKAVLKDVDDNQKALNLINTCAAVNDQAVSDDKGCERAKLMIDCYLTSKEEDMV